MNRRHGPECECNVCDRVYCTCGDCVGCSAQASYIRDTTCACCKFSEEGENISAADAVVNNNGLCVDCRDAGCTERFVGERCFAAPAPAMTPSQVTRWKRHAYWYRWEAPARCTNEETVRFADLDLAGVRHPPLPRDIDARCQPVKTRPEGYR